MHKAFLFIYFFLLLANASAFATTRKVLFIGDSYTFTNNMPLMVKSIALAFGDTLIYDESDPGGYTLQQHTTNATTISKIASQPWDIVVMHEQSEMPSFPPAQVMTDVYPYATRLDSMVHANDTCSQTMFLMTWGHANGDPSNCASYPVICTYDGMQQRLRESYMQMALDNHAAVGPVGMAFKIMMDSLYTPWLYTTDSSHPIVPGSYLEACVVYASIFHKKTIGCSYVSGLSVTDAGTLQRIADKVVFDSIALWQQNGHYPFAGFATAVSGNTVALTAHPDVSCNNSWSFGDLTTDTAANPIHSYAGSGTYIVAHTVTTSCFTETLTDTLMVGTAGIENMTKHDAPITISQGDNASITFKVLTSGFEALEVYNSIGVRVRRYNAPVGQITDRLLPGLYIYRLLSENDKEIITGKISVF